MENDKIIKSRRNVLDWISGQWESDEFIDSELNKKCKITFTIDENFGLTNYPVSIEASKKYSDSHSSKIITIVFWWLNDCLASSYTDFRGGIFNYISAEKVGLYSNFEFKDDNLIMKFKKI